MPVARKIDSFIERSSWIRRMFEEGARLKAEHGADKVFDFSLGNPNLEPPAEFDAVIEDLLTNHGPGYARLHAQRRLSGDARGGGRLPDRRSRGSRSPQATWS